MGQKHGRAKGGRERNPPPPPTILLPQGCIALDDPRFGVDEVTPEATEEAHSGLPCRMAWAADAQWLASMSMSGDELFVWDLSTGRRSARMLLPRGTRFRDLAWSPTQPTLLASADDGGAVRLWVGPSGEPDGILAGHPRWVSCVSFAPDGTRLLSGGQNGEVMVWSVALRQRLFEFKAHSADVRRVVMSPDATWLATASWDRTARVWSLTSERSATMVAEMAFPGEIFATDCAFSPAGDALVVCTRAPIVPIWRQGRHWKDAALNNPAIELSGHQDIVDYCQWVSDDLLVTASNDRTLRMWCPRSGHCLVVMPMVLPRCAASSIGLALNHHIHIKLWFACCLSHVPGVTATCAFFEWQRRAAVMNKHAPCIARLQSSRDAIKDKGHDDDDEECTNVASAPMSSSSPRPAPPPYSLN